MKKILLILCLMVSSVALASGDLNTVASDLVQSTSQLSKEIDTLYQAGSPWNSAQVATAQSQYADIGTGIQKLAQCQFQMNSRQEMQLQEMATKYTLMHTSVDSMSTLTLSQMSTLNGQALDIKNSAQSIADGGL